MKKYNLSPLTALDAERIIKEIMCPPTRELEGEDYNKVRTLLLLSEPYDIDISSQNYIVESYKVGDDEYRAYYFGNSTTPLIDLMLKEENE